MIPIIVSNCVICLSPDKESVFHEMFRVLKPGGMLAIADEIAVRPFSKEEKSNPEKWCRCVTGVITEEEYSRALKELHFEKVYVKQLRPWAHFTLNVFSAFISAAKPSR